MGNTSSEPEDGRRGGGRKKDKKKKKREASKDTSKQTQVADQTDGQDAATELIKPVSAMQVDAQKDHKKELEKKRAQLRRRTSEVERQAQKMKLGDMDRLKRFVFLGSDDGTYKSETGEMSKDKVEFVDSLISAGRGEEVVSLVQNVSDEATSIKREPLLYVLAVCARSNDLKTKQAAYKSFLSMCRVPAHLFLFVEYCQQESIGTGWGRAHRKAIATWYENAAAEDPMHLALIMTKYPGRAGWTHEDLFKLSHIKPVSDALKILVKFAKYGLAKARALKDSFPKTDSNAVLEDVMVFLEAAKTAHKCTNEESIIPLIQKHGLVREHMPTQLLKSPAVWKELLKNKMPDTALVRNLGRMSHLGLLNEDEECTKIVLDRLKDKTQLEKGRIHPFNLLIAMLQYSKGRGGDNSNLSWIPNPTIIKALTDAYHLSFENVKPSGKRLLLAIDVCDAMNDPCNGCSSITCRQAAAAMIMTMIRTEKNFEIVAFTNIIKPMSFDKDLTLEQVLKITTAEASPHFGNCALPITWASENKKEFDAVIIYTGNMAKYAKIRPDKALKDYRGSIGKDVKLVVVGMSSSGFTIADPADPRMLDIVGFDATAPEIVANFIRGDITKSE